MSISAEPNSLLQNEVQILNAKLGKLLIGAGIVNVLQLDIADLSDHCPVISLQTLEVWPCQWPSLTGMEHCIPHTRAVHAATCLDILENKQTLIKHLGGQVVSTPDFGSWGPGPSCSKLTMSLVNDMLKFTSSDTQICWNFLLKKCE